jgi:hypothetical protein
MPYMPAVRIPDCYSGMNKYTHEVMGPIKFY